MDRKNVLTKKEKKMKRVLVVTIAVAWVVVVALILGNSNPVTAQPAPDPLNIKGTPVPEIPPPIVPMAAPPASYYPPRVVNSANATGGVTIWATHTEERFQIGSLFISSDTAMTVTLYDGSLAIPVYVGANGGACPNIKPGWQSHTQGNDLTFTTSVAGNITVVVTGESVWY